MDNDNNSPWQYKSDGETKDDTLSQPAQSAAPAPKHLKGSLSWQAPEFIAVQHSVAWYGGLILVTAGLTAAIYFITSEIFAAAVIVLLGIILGIYAGQKPKPASYEITSRGLSINGKPYNYGAYKSFTVFREGQLSSLNLFPLKRLSPPISAYFPPADEAKIINTVGNYLPYEDRQIDSIDRLTRRLHL